MARLARLILPELSHLLSQRAQHGQAMVRDDEDRERLLALVREAARLSEVRIHAYGLTDGRIDLVASAARAESLSLMMQAAARRHAAAFNRRHSRQGSLWEGRFRAAVVEPGEWLLRCILHVDRLATPHGDPGGRWSSQAAHSGHASDAWLVAPAEYWALGNTPFERERAWRSRLETPINAGEALEIEAALRGGWPLGTPAFAARLEPLVNRPTQRQARGRPRKPV